MDGWGMAWDGMGWHGMAWDGMGWHGTARHGMDGWSDRGSADRKPSLPLWKGSQPIFWGVDLWACLNTGPPQKSGTPPTKNIKPRRGKKEHH